MLENNESILIEACRKGDKAAMNELFGQHYMSCLRLARGILRTEAECEDVVQTAYFSAFRHLHHFRGDASFKTWITRIVINQCRMLLREPRRRMAWISLDDLDGGPPPVVFASTAPNPEKATLLRETEAALSDAIASLPVHMRDVFTLCAVSGVTVQQAANSLGLSLSAAKSRLFRANARLRSRLKPVWRERIKLAA
jgi:RNA polymerase sigma-70 factor (ECF subfamily)